MILRKIFGKVYFKAILIMLINEAFYVTDFSCKIFYATTDRALLSLLEGGLTKEEILRKLSIKTDTNR